MNAPFVIHSTAQGAWSVPEAFLGVLTLAGVWDGQHASARLAAVHAFAKRSPFLATLGEAGLNQLQEKVVERIGESSGDPLSRACAALPREMGASIYAACVDILASTGELSESDRTLMAELRSLLRIEAGLAEQIETVAQLKNRY